MTLLCILIICSCSTRTHNSELAEIDKLCDSIPNDAISRLKDIDYSSLSERDRHYYDLLSIKANDKAYVEHTSDSLILDVIKWYESHPKSELYPVVLYYGGRVYSDLGDYPTSLKYFQQALSTLPSKSENLALKATILSQIGRLFNTLRIYNEASVYIKEAIIIDQQLNDTVNEIFDLQMLGYSLMQTENFKEAESYLYEALLKSNDLDDMFRARTMIYLSQIKFEEGDLDSAIYIVRQAKDSLLPLDRNVALASAARYFQKAGIADSAYFYAKELINNDNRNNKEVGYRILCSPELKDLVSSDSIIQYVNKYVSIVNYDFNEHENQLALIQQSYYNYQLHEREKSKAEEAKKRIERYVLILIFLFLVVLGGFMYQKMRNQKQIILYQQALDSIAQLKQQISGYNSQSTQNSTDSYDRQQSLTYRTDQEQTQESDVKTIENLRKRLREELLELYNNSEKHTISPELLNSNAFKKLQIMIEKESILKDNDELWEELEKNILMVSPSFFKNLNILTLGNLTKIDYRTAILLKYGLRPSQISLLLVKSNGAIISRREVLSKKIFDKKMGVAVIDGIILLL